MDVSLTVVLLFLAGAIFGSGVTIIFVGFWAAHEVAKEQAARDFAEAFELMRTRPDVTAVRQGATTYHRIDGLDSWP